MTGHTKEPWRVYADNRTDFCRHTQSELSYVAGWNIESDAEEIVGCEGIISGPTSEANARRIVDCVNALAGIEDPAEYVKAFEDMMEVLDLVLKMNPNSSRDYVAITATVIRVLTAARQARGEG